MTTVLKSELASPRLLWTGLALALPFLLTPVFAVGGFKNPFAYWNAVPIVVSLIVLAVAGIRPVACAFSAVTIGLIEMVHLAWFANGGGVSTGSSTSGLIFIFIPFWGLLLGLAAALVVWLVRRFVARNPKH